MSYLAQDPDSV